MKRTFKAAVAALILVAGVAGSAAAGPWEDAAAAFQRGDYATAMRLWRPFADQGNAEAQTAIGIMYAKGRGVPQDYATAVSWYRKAADQGNAEGQSLLGYMYAKGRGVPQDYVNAHMWFNLAAAGGNKDAAEYRNIAAAKMTTAQTAEAQRLARKWKPGRK
jgi:uncharacterized protein